MSDDPRSEFLLGEYPRTLDERFRLTLPPELAAGLCASGPDCILAKQQVGALSLWPAAVWREKLNSATELVRGKMRAGKLEGRLEDVQTLGRLLSTRHREVQIAARGRLSIPEGFREFLQVEPAGDVLVIGAAVCVEIWQPAAWLNHLQSRMPEFQRLFDQLSG